MALPAQAIEKLAYASEKTPGVYGQLIMLSLSLLVLALFLWAGLTFGYQPYLDSRLSGLEEEIRTFGETIPIDKQSEIATLYSQLINLQKVLENHTNTSPFFLWLEKNTVPNVYYVKAAVNVSQNQVVLQGAGKGMDDINNQLRTLGSAAEVKKLSVGSVGNTVQGWQFNLTLDLKDDFFGTISQ